jgi:hypothetical protein
VAFRNMRDSTKLMNSNFSELRIEFKRLAGLLEGAGMKRVFCQHYLNSVYKHIRETNSLYVTQGKRYRQARNSHKHFGTLTGLKLTNSAKPTQLFFECGYLKMQEGKFVLIVCRVHLS